MNGLVLEGGAMRGLFSAGVMDVMMENGIAFDGVIGVSAGAAFGCNYKSRQPGRVIRYNVRFARDPKYGGLRSLILTGDLYGADYCYRVVPREKDIFDVETYESNPMPFYVVCTDVDTGEAVYHRLDRADDEGMQWIRASASMPVVSRVVEVGGRRMLDGGIADSIPLRAFEERGFDRNVVILTQPEGFVKKPSRGMRAMRLLLKDLPAVCARLETRHEAYNAATAYVKQREAEGAALVIRPEAALPIGRTEHDPEKMKAVYELGRQAGLKRLEEIRQFTNR